VDVEDRRPRLGGHPDAELDRLGEDDLLLGREERDARDLAQVQTRGVLDIERLLVDDLGRLLVGIRRRRHGNGRPFGLLLGGLRRELYIARLGDALEAIWGDDGHQLGLGRLDPLGFVVDELDQGCSAWRRNGTRRPPLRRRG
jgi:hypothetical protein